MGEYADDLIDQGFAEGGWPGRRFRPIRPRCARCGAANLMWSQRGSVWTLMNGDFTPHVCKVDPVQEFEDLDK